MQHNIQDLLRFGTHLLHTSSTIVKNAAKRDIIPLNLNEFYQLECYDTAIKGQSKQQFDIDNDDDGIIIDHA
jgi:hypothetical protein